MKKSTLLATLLLPLIASAETSGKITITGQNPGDEVALAPYTPAVGFGELMEMFITPDQIQQVTVGADSTAVFDVAPYPAFYHWVNTNDTRAEITIAAMPGDNITLKYMAGEYWPAIIAPKATADIIAIQKAIYPYYQENLRKSHAEGAGEADKEAAKAEFQQHMKELSLANSDNAGGIYAAFYANRHDWKELLSHLKPEALESPVIAPTWAFMMRCVNWGVTAKFNVTED